MGQYEAYMAELLTPAQAISKYGPLANLGGNGVSDECQFRLAQVIELNSDYKPNDFMITLICQAGSGCSECVFCRGGVRLDTSAPACSR